ncbi:tyrosine-type recombinase/integrase [Desulfarculus baarsii]
MAVKWHGGKFPGVRYYEHETRKHGLKPDRYYCLRYQAAGKRREEGLGWASEGWTEHKAALELARLKEAARTGQGPASLQEKRRLAQDERQAQEAARERLERERLSFGQFWRESYFPHAQANKSRQSWRREDHLFRLWIEPVIGRLPLKDVGPLHLERIKKNLADAGRAPRTCQYCLAVTRQAFNRARVLGLFAGDSPTGKVKSPKVDNRRLRFLTTDEAERLLAALAEVSIDLRDMAMLSLLTGMRAGEVFGLAWGDVDLVQDMLTIRDGKNGETRHAYLTGQAKAMLQARGGGQPSELVFPARGGGRRDRVSTRFSITVNQLGLNAGVHDPRQKVFFHTLRHTFASWLVMRGTPLYTVQKLLGHKTMIMTQRYAHLAPDHLREAIKGLELALDPSPAKVVELRASQEGATS